MTPSSGQSQLADEGLNAQNSGEIGPEGGEHLLRCSRSHHSFVDLTCFTAGESLVTSEFKFRLIVLDLCTF